VMATSFEPLQLYAYPDGLLFWTRAAHSTHTKDWSHRNDFITDYFHTEAQGKLCLTLSELRVVLAQQGVDEALMWARIKDSAVRAILPVAHRIAQKAGLWITRRGAVQHVFGYDVVIDTDGKPFVLEINTHPNLDLEMSEIADPVMRQQVRSEDRSLKSDLIRHIVRLGGFAEQPEQRRAEASAAVERRMAGLGWATGKACSTAQRCLAPQEYQDLIVAQQEDTIKGPFERIFPTSAARNLMPLVAPLTRTKILMAYWSASGGDLDEYNSDGTYKVPRAPYRPPKATKHFPRDTHKS